MSDSLDSARQTVSSLIQNGTVPAQLVGEISLSDLLSMVEDIVDDGIKQHLTELETASETEAEQLMTNLVESVSVQVGLICIQAAIQELGNQPDFELGISPETVTGLMTSLFRGEGVAIKLGIAEPS